MKEHDAEGKDTNWKLAEGLWKENEEGKSTMRTSVKEKSKLEKNSNQKDRNDRNLARERKNHRSGNLDKKTSRFMVDGKATAWKAADNAAIE